MTTKILKYCFPDFSDEATFEMSEDAVAVHADVQNDKICVWARVTENSPTKERRFIVRGTGEEIEPQGENSLLYKYVSTFLVNEFVFHVFEDQGYLAEQYRSSSETEWMPVTHG